MSVIIRPAKLADAEAIAHLMRGLAIDQGDPDDQVTPATVERDLLGPSRVLTAHVAETEGGVVGYVAFHSSYESSYAARGLYVSDIYVAPELRRRGIARKLLASVARAAKAEGLVYLWWVSQPGNATAHRLYRSIADIEEPVLAHAVTDEAFQRLADEA